MANSEHKMTFSMGTSGDAEIIRAFESMQKVINGTGESMRMLETNGVKGIQNWIDSFKKVNEIEKTLKSLGDTMSAVDKEMLSGILSKEKSGLFSGMSASVDVLTARMKSLRTEIVGIQSEAKQAEAAGNMSKAKQLHEQAAIAQGYESNLAKIIVSGHAELAKGMPSVPGSDPKLTDPSMMQRFMAMFSQGGMMAGGFNPQSMLMNAGRFLPAAGLGYLAYQGVNNFVNPEAALNRQITTGQSALRPSMQAMGGDPTTAILRSSGLGTAEQMGRGENVDPIGVLKYLKDYAIGSLTSGVNASDYATAQSRDRYEQIDKQRFSQLDMGNKFRYSIAEARLRESRMFGQEDVEAGVRTYGRMGISEETGRAGSSLLATYQGRNADVRGSDAAFLSGARDLGLTQAGMQAIARRYQGVGMTGEGVNRLTSAMAVAGLGVNDQSSREMFQQYVASQQEKYGANVSIGDTGATGAVAVAGTQAAVNAAGFGGSIGKADITTAALNTAQAFAQQEQSPGSARHMLLKAQLLKMGISPQMAEIFIQMGVDNPETKKKIAGFLQARTGTVVSADSIGSKLAGATAAANKMATLAVSDADQAAAAGVGIDAKAMTLAGSTKPEDAAAARANMEGQFKLAKTISATDDIPANQRNKQNVKDEGDKKKGKDFESVIADNLPSIDNTLKSIQSVNDQMLLEFKKQTADMDERKTTQTQSAEVKSFGDWQRTQSGGGGTAGEYQNYLSHQVTDVKKAPKTGP